MVSRGYRSYLIYSTRGEDTHTYRDGSVKSGVHRGSGETTKRGHNETLSYYYYYMRLSFALYRSISNKGFKLYD